MPRSYSTADLVVLPNLDANGALALARSLEAAAAAQKKQGQKLPEAVTDALSELAEDREDLADSLADTPAPEADVRAADRDEDAAIGALYALLSAWARLAEAIPEGDTAQALLDRLFPNGASFVNLKVEKEWSAVETKLASIAKEKLDKKLGELGAVPMLEHLKKVHERYGEVIGTTKPRAPVESPQVGEKRAALLDSMRQYVMAVNGSVRRKKPDTKTLADALLVPLTQWESAPAKPKATKPDEKKPGDG